MQKYKQTGDVHVRNELVLQYSHLVRCVALSMRNMLYSKYAESEDIINEGMLALIRALEHFDPAKNVKFETYASIKIRGAMIDYLRRQDWVPRQLRRFSKELNAAFSELSSRLDHAPTNAELATHMNISEERLNKAMGDAAGAVTLSFEELLYEDQLDVEDNKEGSGVWSTERRIFDEELRAIIALAIDSLSEKERLVISLYYYERLKFSDIAKVLEVSDSRISQIHTKAMLSLKNKLETYIKG